MENRERDRVSQRNSSTEAGDVNRKTSEDLERGKSGTSTEFGQNIGRSENLSEGGNMRNRDEEMNRNESQSSDLNKEPSRRESGDSGFGSSSGRSGSSSIERERDEEQSSINRQEKPERGMSGSRSSEH